MQIISNIALISINETMVVQLISFLIFLFVMNRIMFRPLKSVIDERENFMVGLKDEIVDTDKAADAIIMQLKEKESDVRSQAVELKAALEDEGNRKASELHTEIQKKIAELRQKTEADISVQVETARQNLKTESETLAVRIMEKVLDRRVAA